MKITYRNVWTGATFVVIGKAANERMAAFKSWQPA